MSCPSTNGCCGSETCDENCEECKMVICKYCKEEKPKWVIGLKGGDWCGAAGCDLTLCCMMDNYKGISKELAIKILEADYEAAYMLAYDKIHKKVEAIKRKKRNDRKEKFK